ncbi:hypothetical protein N7493_006913 [Penicillium malachiteum]|uniref:Uncharacterized protein n=1 Tax=Penicillium malachiteum TaxID=1324776 RepID=A0AAD6HJS7_9EURO|nr:hypothetical protein N7488_008415 [Penicillium malachiteum]KAJ5720035.1 hypothetical protein N7493_006913 [Penicillium malachiteum]
MDQGHHSTLVCQLTDELGLIFSLELRLLGYPWSPLGVIGPCATDQIMIRALSKDPNEESGILTGYVGFIQAQRFDSAYD